jgi:hypothetical protein
VVSSPANADLAYDGYLLGHTAWFRTPHGAAVLDHLRRRPNRLDETSGHTRLHR